MAWGTFLGLWAADQAGRSRGPGWPEVGASGKERESLTFHRSSSMPRVQVSYSVTTFIPVASETFSLLGLLGFPGWTREEAQGRGCSPFPSAEAQGLQTQHREAFQ